MNNKVVLLVCLFSFVARCLSAQSIDSFQFTSKRDVSSVTGGTLEKKKNFTVSSVSFAPITSGSTSKMEYVVNIRQDNRRIEIPVSSFPKELPFSSVDDNIQSYWLLKNMATLKTISELSDLFATKAEMESEANEYLRYLSRNGLLFDDPFLETYLYSIVSRIVPPFRPDGFPYELKVVICRDNSLNACAFPNGYLVINSGLLAELHTEDELVGVMAHEIAHFICNHALMNMRAMEKRIAKAEFWAKFATTAAAITEGFVEAFSGYYDGSLTMSTALTAYSMASEAVARFGANYSQSQEKEADLIAKDVLSYLGYDPNGVASLFNRMSDAYNKDGNLIAYYQSGDHPSLKERIGYSGVPYKRSDSKYEQIVSFAVTESAIGRFNRGHFNKALELVSQNIKNGVGTDADYLLKALCLMNLNPKEKDGVQNEVLSSIQKAKELNANNVNLLRTEIVASMFYGQKQNATTSLDSYIKQLLTEMTQVQDKDSRAYSFYSQEYEWARKMAIKVKGM